MAGPTSARLTQLPDRGTLAEHAIPDLLLAAWRARFHGELTLVHGATTKTVVFREGAPTRIDSNVESERLVAQLERSGQLSAEDAARVNAKVESQRTHEAVALLALKLLDAKALLKAVKSAMQVRILETFGWSAGEFRTEKHPKKDDEESAGPRVSLEPLAVIQTGLVRYWGASRLLEHLASDLETYVELPGRARETAERLRLDDAGWAMLDRLDGNQKLGDALGPAASSETAIAALWILDRAGLVRRHAISRREAQAEADGPERFEFEIEVSGMEAASVSGATSAAGPAASAPKKDKSADADALRAEIEEKKVRLGELDHYELLGVEEQAKAVEIKKAYFKAAKRFHPDALARLGLGDCKEDAARVFARIAEAFETLSDASKRQQYDAELSGELSAADANLVAQAEKNFRKGEILAKMGDFRGALEYLQAAVEIWPDECAYRSGYGWALFRQNASAPEAALEQLEAAVALDPADKEAQTRIAMVYRALGREDDAQKALEAVRR